MSLSSSIIVITGAAGFIGRRVVERLLRDGRRVVAVDRVEAPAALPDGVCYHQTDLCQPGDLIPSSMDVSGGFTLVHLAWDMRREHPYQTQAASLQVLATLLDYWTDKGLVSLVGMGSAEEYGLRSGTIKEADAPVLPLTPYGWAKRSAYLMASSWAQREQRNLVWLRPFIVYGEGQGGSMLLPYAMQMARDRKPAEFTDGLQERDFVHVDDVADAIVRAATRAPIGIHVANLGCNLPVRVRDVLDEIARLTNSQSLFQFGVRPRRPGEPDRQVADIAAALHVLAWQPSVEWKGGLARWTGSWRSEV